MPGRKRKLSNVYQVPSSSSPALECTMANSNSSAVDVSQLNGHNFCSDNSKSWDSLMPEILTRVFQYIEVPERFKFELVCGHWRNVLKSKHLLNIGIVRFESWMSSGLGFYDLVGYLVEVKEKEIGGISVVIDPLVHNRPSLDFIELSSSFSQIYNWDCFKHFEIVVRDGLDSVGRNDSRITSLIRFPLYNAYNLRSLLVTKTLADDDDQMELEAPLCQVDISYLYELRHLHMHGYFPVNSMANQLTTLSLGHICEVDYEKLMEVIRISAETLKSLELVDMEVRSGIRKRKKQKSMEHVTLPSLEFMDITSIGISFELGIDLTESKLKHIVCTTMNISVGGGHSECPLRFNDVSNFTDNNIDEFCVECFSEDEVMEIMNCLCNGTKYEQLRKLSLNCCSHDDFDELSPTVCLDEDQSEIICTILPVLFENAICLRVLELPDVTFDRDHLVEIVRNIKAKVDVENGSYVISVGDVTCTAAELRRKLMQTLTMDEIESENEVKVSGWFVKGGRLKGRDQEIKLNLKDQFNVGVRCNLLH